MNTTVRFSVAVALVAIVPTADAAAQPSGVAKADPGELGIWVMNYYRKPDPDAVQEKVRQMSEVKMLKSNRPEANEMFLSRVMAANPKRIAGWMKAWKDLPEADRAVLRNAVALSQTDQGKAWLKENGHADLADKPAHPFFTNAAMVLEPYHVDQLWEWFFATGDASPGRRAVGFFNMLNADPGKDDLPALPAADVDRPTALRQTIGRVAVWSSSSLATSHDRLLEVLKETERDPQLPPRAGAWLRRSIEIAERERKKKMP
jgi:hypothetical protein